jgi:hypothetical protein
MKKLIFVFLILATPVCVAQNTRKPVVSTPSPKQLIPNPAFQVTIDDLAFLKALQKLGYNNIMQVPAGKLKEVMTKLMADTANQSKVNGWTLWQNLQTKTNEARMSERVKNNKETVSLNIAKPHFLGTYLNERLQAGKKYRITFQFPHIDPIHTLPASQVPQLGITFLPTSPKEILKAIRPQKKYKFKQDTEAKHYAKRQSVVKSFEREYGGNFESKEWQDFQGKRNPKDKYTTITFEYRADGDEIYFVVGNFQASSQNQTQILLNCYRLLVEEIRESNTLKD